MKEGTQNIKNVKIRLFEKSGSIIRAKKERNILHVLKRIQINWIDHIFRRNCSLNHAIEGKK